MNIIQTPEVKQHMDSQLTVNVSATQWGKNSLFNKRYGDKWTCTRKGGVWTLSPHHTQNNVTWIKDFNLRT